jgi:hypothetical protein
MPNATCAQLLQVYHLRVVALDESGAVAPGADSLYEHTRPVSLGFTETRPDRVRFEQPDGAGETCGLFQGPPRKPETVELTLDLCKYDAELLEVLLGGTLITNGSYGTVGYQAATDADINVNGVAIEAWSIAWDGNTRKIYLGDPAWYRHSYPKTTWQLGTITMSNDGFSTIPLTGVGEVNPQYGTGLPADPFPASSGQHPYSWVLDNSIPEGSCGVLEVA